MQEAATSKTAVLYTYVHIYLFLFLRELLFFTAPKIKIESSFKKLETPAVEGLNNMVRRLPYIKLFLCCPRVVQKSRPRTIGSSCSVSHHRRRRAQRAHPHSTTPQDSRGRGRAHPASSDRNGLLGYTCRALVVSRVPVPLCDLFYAKTATWYLRTNVTLVYARGTLLLHEHE